ncbi:MAG: COG4705 family protein [Caulobacteraceae bacterium]
MSASTTSDAAKVLSKVPAVTLGFWVIKILATTIGETGGDTVTMTWLGETTRHADPFGYLIGTAIFALLLVGLVWLQIRARRFNAWLYWATIVASTTAGTTMADFFDRSLGIGYVGGSSALLTLVLLSLSVWWRSERTISVDTVSTPRVETFYWITITFSQTLGTALGDWMADDAGVGFLGGALIFLAALAVLAALSYWTRISRVALFWAAFILTRPLGATVGDFLDKPLNHGGLALSRPIATLVIAIAMILLIVIIPQRPGVHPTASKPAT